MTPTQKIMYDAYLKDMDKFFPGIFRNPPQELKEAHAKFFVERMTAISQEVINNLRKAGVKEADRITPDDVLKSVMDGESSNKGLSKATIGRRARTVIGKRGQVIHKAILNPKKPT